MFGNNDAVEHKQFSWIRLEQKKLGVKLYYVSGYFNMSDNAENRAIQTQRLRPSAEIGLQLWRTFLLKQTTY